MLKRAISIIALISFALSLAFIPNIANASTKSKGAVIISTATHDGIHAYVSTGVGTVNGNEFNLYAMNPDRYQVIFSSQVHPRNSCLQAEVYHERPTGGSTSHFFQFYNWCAGNSIAYRVNLKTDTTFRSKYVRTFTWNDTGVAFNDETLEYRIILLDAASNTWGGYLYNYNTSTYDFIVSNGGSAGTVDGFFDWGDGGGTQDSPNPYCPPLNPTFVQQIRGIQLRNSGVWSNLQAWQIQFYWDDPMYCFNTVVLYKKTTPQPQIFKILPSNANY